MTGPQTSLTGDSYLATTSRLVLLPRFKPIGTQSSSKLRETGLVLYHSTGRSERCTKAPTPSLSFERPVARPREGTWEGDVSEFDESSARQMVPDSYLRRGPGNCQYELKGTEVFDAVRGEIVPRGRPYPQVL